MSQPAATPTPEQHEDKDFFESTMRRLKGARPSIFHTSSYYEGAKQFYMCLTGLPVVGAITPTVEAVAERVVEWTPLKSSPEEKTMAVLDGKIREALKFADNFADSKKDEAIESIVSFKNAIFKSVVVRFSMTADSTKCAVVGVAESVQTTGANTLDLAKNTTACMVNSTKATAVNAVDAAKNAAGGLLSTAKNAVGGTLNTAKNAVGNTIGGVSKTAKNAFGNTVGRGKAIWSTAAKSVASTFSWATSTVMSFVGNAIALPSDALSALVGNTKAGHSVGGIILR
ncbi:unnamed protein product [Pylaiella littoralis]